MRELHDKIIISTQPEDSFPDLVKALKDTGARVTNFPMIAVVEAPISELQESQIKNVGQFQWLVFTSKNGIQYFFQKYKDLKGTPFLPDKVKTAVIGEKTGKELLTHGITPDFISKSNLAEIFAKELKEMVIPYNANVLLLLGNLAGNTLSDTLQNHALVQRIDCYETIKPQEDDLYHIKIIASGKYDLIIFTSSSAFQNFAEIVKKYNIDIKNLKVVSIGKSTTKTMAEYGVNPVFTAKQSNIEGISEEIRVLYKK
jgi:uroporphyrinogen-III synthase